MEAKYLMTITENTPVIKPVLFRRMATYAVYEDARINPRSLQYGMTMDERNEQGRNKCIFPPMNRNAGLESERPG